VHLAAAVQAFASIFPAELPDKTALACIVLVGRHRSRSAVFLGVAAAFALHVTLAVAAGSALTHLPERPLALATALAFGAGALVMWRSAGHGQSEDVGPDHLPAPDSGDGAGDRDAPAGTARRGRVGTLVTSGRWAAVLSSFGVVAIAEFGDLTQLATAGLAVHTGAPLEVAIGAFAALCAVAALAVIVGQRLLGRLRVETLQKVAAGLFGLLAVATVTKVF